MCKRHQELTQAIAQILASTMENTSRMGSALNATTPANNVLAQAHQTVSPVTQQLCWTMANVLRAVLPGSSRIQEIIIRTLALSAHADVHNVTHLRNAQCVMQICTCLMDYATPRP